MPQAVDGTHVSVGVPKVGLGVQSLPPQLQRHLPSPPVVAQVSSDSCA